MAGDVNGEQIFQIDTAKDGAIDFSGGVKQTLQVDRQQAKLLIDLLKTSFKL